MVFRFKHKLLLALLSSNLVLVVLMATLLYVSTHQGITRYLQQVEKEELQPLVSALLAAYEHFESWNFIEHKKETWGLFIRYLPGGDWEKQSPDRVIAALQDPEQHRPLPQLHGRRPGRLPEGIGPEGPPRDTSSLNWRLTLLDARKNIVFGRRESEGEPILIPLGQQDNPVGWLQVVRLQWLERGLADQFLQNQLATTITGAAIALVIALILALVLGRIILTPLTLVIASIRQLGRGNFNHRITAQGPQDEFSELITDVNTLAQTLSDNRRLRQTMMAEISHELRTPVSVLQANIEAMQDGIRPCDNDSLARLHSSVGNLSRLIDDLFTLALADSGTLPNHRQAADIIALIQHNCALYEPLFYQKNLAFSHHFDQPVEMAVDPQRFAQVISNLLNNAYRYTDSPGTVRLRTWVENNQCIISLEDSAPGVPPPQRSRIFDRFFRVDTSRSREHGGSGLGLALCQTIVAAHGGTIEAGPSELGGLAIIIRLPLREGIS